MAAQYAQSNFILMLMHNPSVVCCLVDQYMVGQSIVEHG
jgi:hypothetical protein